MPAPSVFALATVAVAAEVAAAVNALCPHLLGLGVVPRSKEEQSFSTYVNILLFSFSRLRVHIFPELATLLACRTLAATGANAQRSGHIRDIGRWLAGEVEMF